MAQGDICGRVHVIRASLIWSPTVDIRHDYMDDGFGEFVPWTNMAMPTT